ncbi:hypothetical protein ICW40_20300, partial [Actinotalea ferrariae]|uniref:hypothetical protein n=1 Tax=Actinotalea ferrariae TaxID=1386098 RepID=UPI001C8B4347
MTRRRRDGWPLALVDRAAVVVHRAPTQVPLLATLLAVVVLGTTLLGLCALLLTAGQDSALDASLGSAPPEDVDVRIDVAVVGGDPVAVATELRQTVTDRLGDDTVTTAWVTSSLRALPGEPVRMAYLAGPTDALADHAELVAGRWPAERVGDGPLEAVLLASTASLLGLAPGDEVALGRVAASVAQPEGGRSDDVVTVRVVGTVTATSTPLWEADLLDGGGFDAEVEKPGTSGRVRLPAYGPFLVDGGALLAAEAGVTGLHLVARPDLDGARGGELADVAAGVGGMRRAVAVGLGDDGADVRVISALPATVAAAATQQTVTRSGVLVAALVGT